MKVIFSKTNEGILFLERQKIKRRTRPENFLLLLAKKQLHNLSENSAKILLFWQRSLIFRKICKKPAIKIIEENKVWRAFDTLAIHQL